MIFGAHNNSMKRSDFIKNVRNTAQSLESSTPYLLFDWLRFLSHHPINGDLTKAAGLWTALFESELTCCTCVYLCRQEAVKAQWGARNTHTTLSTHSSSQPAETPRIWRRCTMDCRSSSWHLWRFSSTSWTRSTRGLSVWEILKADGVTRVWGTCPLGWWRACERWYPQTVFLHLTVLLLAWSLPCSKEKIKRRGAQWVRLPTVVWFRRKTEAPQDQHPCLRGTSHPAILCSQIQAIDSREALR